ncbi:type II secretion system protein GspK [Blastococcus sp. SYSU DS0669]
MISPQLSADAPPAPTSAERFRAGGWYFVLTICTGGFLAAVPFWHAASRLRRPEVRTRALAYTAAGVYLMILMALTPPRQPDGTSGNETLSTIGGLSVVLVVVLACIQLRPLRLAVYSGPRPTPVDDDPAVARALGARARREETRQLISREPGLQRELGIGRPDLGRGYDDGGLIDVNTAPADVIARVADIDRGDAEAIVAARTASGVAWFDVAELLDHVPLAPYAQEQLRERAIFP